MLLSKQRIVRHSEVRSMADHLESKEVLQEFFEKKPTDSSGPTPADVAEPCPSTYATAG